MPHTHAVAILASRYRASHILNSGSLNEDQIASLRILDTVKRALVRPAFVGIAPIGS